MIFANGSWQYSASDLLNWRSCEHRSRLDALSHTDQGLRSWLMTRRAEQERALASGDALPEPASARGDQHEMAMLQQLVGQGLTVVEIIRTTSGGDAGLRAATDATHQAMRDGADVVFQAALRDDPWVGYADFLVRVDGVPSNLGNYAYEVRDTKLARSPSANALIQMAHYGAMVEKLQGAPPPRLAIWLGTGELFEWTYADAAPYVMELRAAFLRFQQEQPQTTATPVTACGTCRWLERCDGDWGPEDLRHIHRLTSRQRLLLRDQRIESISQLAAIAAGHRPDGIGPNTFERLRGQAAVQAGEQQWQIVSPQPRRMGVFGTPPANPLDIYFDLEGDPFAAIPTLDYLWAYCDRDGTYFHVWGHSPAEERAAFIWFVNVLRDREKQGSDWQVYHYNTYEVTSMRRIAAAWPDDDVRDSLVEEVDRFIEERFEDLYRRIELGLRTKDGSTSLKIVEKLAGYDRTVDAAAVGRADDSIKAYELFISTTRDAQREEILSGIREYNTHDVRATKAVHDWLLEITAAAVVGEPNGIVLVDDDDDEYTPSDRVIERRDRTQELRGRIVAAADGVQQLPSGLSAGGARLLIEMLTWHVREDAVAYLDNLRLQDWAIDQLAGDASADEVASYATELNGVSDSELTAIRAGTEHESCLLDIEGPIEVRPPTEKGKRSSTYVFRCRPGAWKIKAGERVVEVLADSGTDRKPFSVPITEHDPAQGIFAFTRAKEPPVLGPMVVAPFLGPSTVWEALMRLGEESLRPNPAGWAIAPFSALDQMPPLPPAVMAGVAGESASDRAKRLVAAMDDGLLPVQGPPGTGKTHLACDLILQQIRGGGSDGGAAVVAVTANSHRVMDNLLASVVKRAASEGVAITVAHVGTSENVDTEAGVETIDGGSSALAAWIQSAHGEGRPVVVASTKYGWSRGDCAGIADLLIIDEAGQLPLADAVAVSTSARRVVALGDPQQLAAPIQAAHDDSVQVSLLEHIAQGRPVLPTEVGVFLDVTYRMHPGVCAVIADLAYDGKLQSADVAASRQIDGPDVTVAGQDLPVEPGVSWLPVDGGAESEVSAVVDLVQTLLGSVQVTDVITEPLTAQEILVVAPHNSHVNRLNAALADTGVRVGTVDKFQGQQAHVVIYSMGRVAQAASDVPFLYELNRVNVALSRARLLAVVVSDPVAALPPVVTPEQLLLASRFRRAVSPK
jgi:predicted RecB family nuclease